MVNAASTDALKQDATFWVRPGLADAACYSFESRNYPGQYLRHSGLPGPPDANDGSALFGQDATFCVRAGLAGARHLAGVEELPRPVPAAHQLRGVHRQLTAAPTLGQPDELRRRRHLVAGTAWWRSGVDLTVNAAQSFRVVTPGFTDRYLRHQASWPHRGGQRRQPRRLKADATFYVRRGLADPPATRSSRATSPGHYLRHADFRIHKDARDNSTLFDKDATFCAKSGLATGGVSGSRSTSPAITFRHYAEEVHVAVPRIAPLRQPHRLQRGRDLGGHHPLEPVTGLTRPCGA